MSSLRVLEAHPERLNVTKTDLILKLMQDGKPRSLVQIEEELGIQNLSSQVTNLYQTGRLWASDIRHTVMLKYSGKWKWSRARKRWYISPSASESSLRAEIVYEEWSKTDRKNVLKRDILEFKQYGGSRREKRQKRTPEKVLEVLNSSPVALFPCEIAQRLGLEKRKVTSALFTLSTTNRVRKAGWVKSENRPRRGERVFDRGWLYYTRIQQLAARLGKRDVLTGTKQFIYEAVRKHTEIHRQFTRLRALTREMGLNPKTIADNIREIMDVYPDMKQIEISGDCFYYIDGFLSPKEIETEKKFWEMEVSERSSYKNALGRCHEQFCQLAIDLMDEKGDFKFGQPWWEFVIKNGKKRYRIYKPRISDPRKRFEYDRVLHIPFPLGKNEIILVLEAKYRGNLGKGYYKYFIGKLADTQGFGCVREVEDIRGHYVKIRAVKHNVIPVFVIPTTGRDNVDVGRGNLVNFAQYVTMQGGLVVFTQEFERYLATKFGRKLDFQKQFNNWYKTGEGRTDFTKYIIEYLGSDNLSV